MKGQFKITISSTQPEGITKTEGGNMNKTIFQQLAIFH